LRKGRSRDNRKGRGGELGRDVRDSKNRGNETEGRGSEETSKTSDMRDVTM